MYFLRVEDDDGLELEEAYEEDGFVFMTVVVLVFFLFRSMGGFVCELTVLLLLTAILLRPAFADGVVVVERTCTEDEVGVLIACGGEARVVTN